MSKYDDFEENRYDVLDDETEITSSEEDRTTSKIDTAAIANASATALNGPNGKDVCNTIQYAVGVVGIIILTWLFKGSHK